MRVPNVVLVWGGSPEFKRNLRRTIDPCTTGTYTWGFDRGARVAWEELREDDVLLIGFRGEDGEFYRYHAVIVGKREDPGLARELWGDDRWSRIVLLGEPERIHLPRVELNREFGYSEDYRPIGPARVSPERVKEVVERYGSWHEFVRRYAGG